MKIAIITFNSPNSMGGVERFVFYLQKILLEDGHDVDVIDSSYINYSRNFIDKYVHEIRKAYYIGKVFRQKMNQYDFLFVNGTTGWSINFRNGAMIAHGTYAGVANSLRSHWSWKMYFFHRYILGLFEKLASRGRHVIGVSQSTAQELNHYYKIKSNRITVIQNAVDTNIFRPAENSQEKLITRRKLGLPLDQKLVLFTGSNIIRKGNYVIKDLERLLPPNVRLLIATDKNEHGEFGERAIVFTQVPYANLPDLYRSSDVFLFPSLYEGCSFSLIEAMSCGLPFVASKVGHAKDIAQNDPVLKPFVLESYEPDEYVFVISKFLEDSKLSAEVGSHSRNYVLNNNSFESMRSKYLSLIKR